jgi:hypothetical protein
LDAGEFDIYYAGLRQAMRQHGLCLIQVRTIDYAILLGIDSRADRFREIRM